MTAYYLHTNLVETASAITVSTEDAAYPKANLYNRIKAKPFKFTGTAGGTVLIDWGVAGAVFDTVAIIGHNMTYLSGASITDNLSPPTTWGTPVLADDIVVDVGAQLARYLLLTFTGASATASKIGELWVGIRNQLPRAPRWGVGKTDTLESIRERSQGGVNWNYDLYRSGMLNPEFRFPESEWGLFRKFTQDVGSQPFVFIPTLTAPTAPAITMIADMEVTADATGLSFPQLDINYSGTAVAGTIGGVSLVGTTARANVLFSGFSLFYGSKLAFRPSSRSSVTWRIYSLKFYRDGKLWRTCLPAEMMTWDRENFTVVDVGSYLEGTSTSTGARLFPSFTIGNVPQCIFGRKRGGFEPVPLPPAKDSSVVDHWYDWRMEFEKDSSGLIVGA